MRMRGAVWLGAFACLGVGLWLASSNRSQAPDEGAVDNGRSDGEPVAFTLKEGAREPKPDAPMELPPPDAPAVVLRGRVVGPESAAVRERMRVRLCHHKGVARLDGDGGFTLEVTGSPQRLRQRTLWMNDPQHAWSTLPALVTEAAIAGTDTLELIAQQAVALRIVALGAEGQPAPGADVFVREVPPRRIVDSREIQDRMRILQADAVGVVTIAARPARYRVCARVAKGPWGPSRMVSVDKGDEPQDVQLQCGRDAVRSSILVVDPGGKPVTDALALVAEDHWMSAMAAVLSRGQAHPDAEYLGEYAKLLIAADPRGVIALDGMESTSRSLRVAVGSPRFGRTQVTLKQPSEGEQVRVVLPPLHRIDVALDDVPAGVVVSVVANQRTNYDFDSSEPEAVLGNVFQAPFVSPALGGRWVVYAAPGPDTAIEMRIGRLLMKTLVVGKPAGGRSACTFRVPEGRVVTLRRAGTDSGVPGAVRVFEGASATARTVGPVTLRPLRTTWRVAAERELTLWVPTRISRLHLDAASHLHGVPRDRIVDLVDGKEHYEVRLAAVGGADVTLQACHEGAPFARDRIRFLVQRLDPALGVGPGSHRFVYSSREGATNVQIPAGRYAITARYLALEASVQVDIGLGEQTLALDLLPRKQ